MDDNNDYYFNEQGLLVMTEAYHLQRGYCCGNKCKHCPYDYENVESEHQHTATGTEEIYTYKDQLDRLIMLPDVPKRIISLVPSLTELLCDMGLEDSIVGVTKFCVHPSHLRKQVTVVGGTKKVHVDKVSALMPDFVIANKEENTKGDIEAIEQICPVYVSDIKTPNDTSNLLKDLGLIFHISPLTDKIETQLTSTIPSNLFDGERVAYLIWKSPYMTIGGDTYIQSILDSLKLKNAFGDQDRYPQVTIDELRSAELDYIFLSSEPFPFKQDHIDELALHLPRVQIVLVDGEAFSWYGTRLLKIGDYFRELSEALHET